MLEAGSVSSDPSQSQRLCLGWTPLTGTDYRGGLPAPEDGRASVLFGGNFGAVGTDLEPARHPSLVSLFPASNAVSGFVKGLRTCPIPPHSLKPAGRGAGGTADKREESGEHQGSGSPSLCLHTSKGWELTTTHTAAAMPSSLGTELRGPPHSPRPCPYHPESCLEFRPRVQLSSPLPHAGIQRALSLLRRRPRLGLSAAGR